MHGQRLNILVVDDERVHRYTLCSLFADWGWDCTEADDDGMA